MKVERKEHEFRPITVTFETQDEFDKVFALFNYSTLCDAVGGQTIYDILEGFTFGSSYQTYHGKIDKTYKKKD